MKIDLSLTITAIIALSAIISPIITSILNNLHQSKMKNIEIYEVAKRNALEEYIKASYDLASGKTPITEKNFYIALNKLHLYFSDIQNISYTDLSKIANSSDAQSFYSQELISNLSKQIKKK